MDVVLDAVSTVEALLCLAVAVVLGRRWTQQRSPATASALGVFAVVALVIASSAVQPDDPTRGWGAVYTEVLVCVLVTLPYLLVRLTWALGGVSDRVHRAMAALLAGEVLVTLASPPLPPEGAPRPGWVLAYTVFVLAAWSAQSLVAAHGLWRAGRGESAVVRHRMRSLALGAVVMNLTLVLSSATAEASDVAAVSIALLGLVSIVLFALAFLVPPSLRLLWRQQDLTALSSAERGLMTATTRADVAATIVPVLASVLGGGAAALVGADGEVERAAGLSRAQAQALADRLRDRPQADDVQQVVPGVLAAALDGGWLVVQAGRLAPVFGDDEAVLLGRVATLVDLALQRVSLFEQECRSRRAAEAANDDLETLLHSVSHDLRSPLISVLGYLDVLRQEHGAQLTGAGPHYLERISVNAVYMQHLIADLLELSRIGRNEDPTTPLELQQVARQVVEAASLGAPAASLQVVGTLPPVLMGDVRARQLLTNLVDNAITHSGRDDVQVTVSASDAPDGGLLLHVCDDGVGVPAEYRERVLRVFERLGPPGSGSGTGMGLAICKRICEQVGGTLTLGGPPRGAATGTTVTAVLPPAVRISPVPAQRGTADSQELV